MTDDRSEPSRPRLPTPGVGFLLSQLGFESSRRWAVRLAPLGLDPRQGGVLRVLDASGPMTQVDLARAIRVQASKVVGLVDELEAAGLVERRAEQSDRRIRVIHLTSRGRAAVTDLALVSREHEADLTSGLSAQDRQRLLDLLEQVADDVGLARGVHPGVGEGGRQGGRGAGPEDQ